jgi:hypothetical protein
MIFIKSCFVGILILTSVTLIHAQTKPKTTFEKPAGIFFALSVSDVESLSQWYRDKLGFEIVTSGEAPNKIAKFAILRSEGAIIEMVQHREAKSRSDIFPAAKGAHQIRGIFKVGLVVEDIDQLYKTFKERDVRIAYEMMPAKDVAFRSFIIEDAEKNWLQFFGK